MRCSLFGFLRDVFKRREEYNQAKQSKARQGKRLFSIKQAIQKVSNQVNNAASELITPNQSHIHINFKRKKKAERRAHIKASPSPPSNHAGIYKDVGIQDRYFLSFPFYELLLFIPCVIPRCQRTKSIRCQIRLGSRKYSTFHNTDTAATLSTTRRGGWVGICRWTNMYLQVD